MRVSLRWWSRCRWLIEFDWCHNDWHIRYWSGGNSLNLWFWYQWGFRISGFWKDIKDEKDQKDIKSKTLNPEPRNGWQGDRLTGWQSDFFHPSSLIPHPFWKPWTRFLKIKLEFTPESTPNAVVKLSEHWASNIGLHITGIKMVGQVKDFDTNPGNQFFAPEGNSNFFGYL